MSTATPPRSSIDPLGKAPKPSIERSRFWIVDFYRSAMGKKYVMALSGIIGLGFIVVHALGNLHVYEGAVKFTEYGEGLREIGEPLVPRTFLLWIGRLGLLGALLVHVHAAYTLTWQNRKARPVKYQSARSYITADYASRTMIYTGTILLAFIVFHLADLTWGWTTDEYVRGAITNNLTASLSRIPVALFYILAVLALGTHIYHGTWSLFQTLGLNSTRFNAWRRYLAIGLTVVVTGINLTFPLGTLFGVIECNTECEAVVEEFEEEE
ncbi:succinate dehydrogenase cytochrome b subunit [Euzebya tangerina]|uniref:succinate dehydrogenase cytochrome b subunit n=1 Tax=Euzebya tangerina TaxID=591198 RepID=UPI000E313773|nr:succinate dehydrogenase cytochrome b subunit [Euzebya tangerina]